MSTIEACAAVPLGERGVWRSDLDKLVEVLPPPIPIRGHFFLLFVGWYVMIPRVLKAWVIAPTARSSTVLDRRSPRWVVLCGADSGASFWSSAFTELVAGESPKSFSVPGRGYLCINDHTGHWSLKTFSRPPLPTVVIVLSHSPDSGRCIAPARFFCFYKMKTQGTV